MQQHGWLWKDWDIGGQRQPRDGGHPAGVLWAAAGPWKRRIWKGRLVPASMKGGQKHVTLLVSRPFFFSAGFSSSKGGGSRSRQNICNEGFEEGNEGTCLCTCLASGTEIRSDCDWLFEPSHCSSALYKWVATNRLITFLVDIHDNTLHKSTVFSVAPFVLDNNDYIVRSHQSFVILMCCVCSVVILGYIESVVLTKVLSCRLGDEQAYKCDLGEQHEALTVLSSILCTGYDCP